MPTTLQQIPLVTIDGEEASLGGHAGSVLLVVNVASKCGLTPHTSSSRRSTRTDATRGSRALGCP